MPNSDLNCHFVTRFLTKPWEELPGRDLYFYDFDRKVIGKKSSRRLFAKTGLNDQKTEERINDLVETPLARLVAEVKRGNVHAATNISSWEVFRALTLLFPLQGARLSRLDGSTSEEFFDWSDDKIDQLTWAYQEKYNLIHRTVPAHSPLFFPSHGFFFVPLAEPSLSDPGLFAIPLTPHDALLILPKTADNDGIGRILGMGGGAFLTNASLSTTAPRIVFHPDLLKHHDRAKISGLFEEIRENNVTLKDLCVQRLDVIRRAWAAIGIAPPSPSTQT